MRRTLFIDGSNLYGGLEDLLQPGQYCDFSALLTVIEEDLPVDRVCFYGTYLRIDPARSPAYALRVRAQKAFFDSAKACPKPDFYKGHFSGSGKEKGVDVHLAVDMAVGAATDQFDEAVLMTGDADLKYAVEETVRQGKPTSLAVLGSRYPFGIASIADKTFVYDWDEFFVRNVLPAYRGKPKGLTVRELKGIVEVLEI